MNKKSMAFSVSTFAVSLWTACALAGLQVATTPENLAQSLRAQFSQISTVHLRARYVLVFDLGHGNSKTASATLEYWASGDRFRVESIADPDLAGAGFIGSQTITFDGTESRILTNDNQTLIIKGGEIPDSSVVPNPLFVPLTFLNVESRACADCRPSLADVRRMSTNRLGASDRLRVSTFAGAAGTVELTIAGDSPVGDVKEIRFAGSDASWRPVSSVTRGVDGQLKDRSTFDSAELIVNTTPQLLLPRHLLLEHWSDGTDLPNGAKAVTMDIVIEQLAVNEPIEDDLFTLTDELGNTVIDEDSHQVLRAPSCSKISGKTSE